MSLCSYFSLISFHVRWAWPLTFNYRLVHWFILPGWTFAQILFFLHLFVRNRPTRPLILWWPYNINNNDNNNNKNKKMFPCKCRWTLASTETNKELSGLGTQNFYFQDRKNLKFQDIFQDMRVTKTRFLSFRAHITSERLELRLKLLYDDMK